MEGPGSSPDDNRLPLDKLGCKIAATAPVICWIVSAGRLGLREAGVGKLTAVETVETTSESAVVTADGCGTVSSASDIVR